MGDSIETSKTSSKETEIKEVIESSQAETRTLREKVKDARGKLADGKIGEAIATFFVDKKATPTQQTSNESTSQQQSNNENSQQSNESTSNQKSNGESSDKSNESSQKSNEDNSNKSNESTSQQSSESKEKEPKDSDIVSIKEHITGIKYDLKYATADNSFGGKIIYPDKESNLKLRFDTIKKLNKAQEILKKQGYELKIWDAFRPKDAQQTLWDNYKGPANTKGSNVAKPGTSHHGTGKAVDLTLVDSNGNEVEMPTKFDDFSGNASWNSIDKKDDTKKKNAYILRKAMEEAGFYTIKSEWWHYQIDQGGSTLPHLSK